MASAYGPLGKTWAWVTGKFICSGAWWVEGKNTKKSEPYAPNSGYKIAQIPNQLLTIINQYQGSFCLEIVRKACQPAKL